MGNTTNSDLDRHKLELHPTLRTSSSFKSSPYLFGASRPFVGAVESLIKTAHQLPVPPPPPSTTHDREPPYVKTDEQPLCVKINEQLSPDPKLPPSVVRLPKTEHKEEQETPSVSDPTCVVHCAQKATLPLPLVETATLPPPPVLRSVGVEQEQGSWVVYRLRAGDVSNQNNMTFEFRKIPDLWQSMLASRRETDVNDPSFRIIHAAHVTLTTLKDLYYMEHPGWCRVRDSLKIGMYKETESCGNSSVAMGLATKFFQLHPSKYVVVFVNSGTGGTRFQIYIRLGKTISVLYEYKPAEGNGPGVLSTLEIKDENGNIVYAPRKKKSRDELMQELQRLLEKAPWRSNQILTGLAQCLTAEKGEVEKAVKELDVYAFVTGTIREDYFRKLEHSVERKSMNDAVASVLGSIDAKPFSQIFDSKSELYFLAETLEGQMELLALRTMYSQINAKLKEMNGTPEVLEPIVSLGIGQTSVQWASLTSYDQNDPSEFHVFPYPFGMNNSSRLAGFGHSLVVDHYEKCPNTKKGSLAQLVKVIEACHARSKTPVITLKSGGSLFLTSSAGDAIRRTFVETNVGPHGDPTLIRVFFACPSQQRPRAMQITRAISLPRLCADAQHVLGSSQPFVSVKIEDKPLTVVNMIQENDTLFFSSATSNFTWWPDVEHSSLCMQLPVTLVGDFDLFTTPEMLFKSILEQFFTSHESTSYECIAYVYKLLWHPDLLHQSTSNSTKLAKIMLDLAEQWFAKMMEDALQVKKHRQVLELQHMDSAKMFRNNNNNESPLLAADLQAIPNFASVSGKLNSSYHVMLQECSCYHMMWVVDSNNNNNIITVHAAMSRIAKVLDATIVAAQLVNNNVNLAVIYEVIVDKVPTRYMIMFPNHSDPRLAITSSTAKIPDVQRVVTSRLTEDQHASVRNEFQDEKNVVFADGVPNYLATTSLYVEKESTHITILKALQQVVGKLESVQMHKELLIMVFHSTTENNFRYKICVPFGDVRDVQSEAFLDAIYSVESLLLDLTMVPRYTKNHFPVLHFLSLDCETNKMQALRKCDIKRVLFALNHAHGLRVIHCEQRLRCDGVGDNYLTVIVQWNNHVPQQETKEEKDPDCQHPVSSSLAATTLFHVVLIRVFSEVEVLQTLIHEDQALERQRNNSNNNNNNNKTKKSGGKSMRDASLLEKAGDFFRPQSQGACHNLSQGNGNTVLFHRKAQVLYAPFEAALSNTASILHAQGLSGVAFKCGVKSGRSLQRKLGIASEESTHIIPLSCIEERANDVQSAIAMIPDTPENQGPKCALRACLQLLTTLWNLNDPEWIQVRGKMKTGWVKDTEEFGNTSVSMGAACLLEEHDEVGFLNCGTGGIKYQMYGKQPLTHCINEFKPKQGCNVHNIKFEGLPNVHEKLLQELKDVKLPWHGKPNVPVYAFITGPLRDAWVAADAKRRGKMHERMIKFFRDTNIKPLPPRITLCNNSSSSSNNIHHGGDEGSYFIEQHVEGFLELRGAQEMYANLRKHKKVDENEVIGSLGMGRGSSQWMKACTSMNMNDASMFSYGHGMDHEKELADLPSKWLEDYKQNPHKFKEFVALVRNTASPVLALKSGCTVLLESSPLLKQILFSPASFIYDYLRGTYFLPQKGIAHVTKEIEATLRAINDHIGPIVRIKDQTHLGFIIVNVLFWHAVENKARQTGKTETKSEHRNVWMIGEVQIRVTGAPDDHIIYEIRRNFKDLGDKTVSDAIVNFFSDACNFAFVKNNGQRKLTLHQDARFQAVQEYD